MTRHKFPGSVTEPYGRPPGELQHFRLCFVFAGFVILFVLISLRLGQLHLSPGYQLTEEEQLHIGQIELRQPRGEIFDRNGLLLATDRKIRSLWADPRKISDRRYNVNLQQVVMLLSSHYGLDEDALFQEFGKRDEKGNPRKFIWLKRWIPDTDIAVVNRIIEAGGGAVAIQYEPHRYYPQGESAAHIMGFVNRAGEASEGVELRFNEHLESIPGYKRARKDGHRQLLDTLMLEYMPPTGGDDLYLTIDTAVQHKLEQSLDERMIECEAPAGMGIVMDPYTGAILAMASRPAFDPNRYDDFPPELRKNRAALDMFEPGSVFKIVAAAAALEHGLITPQTLIDCERGAFNPYGHRIRDFYALGVEPFSVCFEQSSNVAIIKVAAMLGAERFEEWILRFGFGQRTCPDLQFESTGLFRSRKEWSRLSMGSLPMGQEIASTMLQLAKAFAVIANGGYIVEPYFVEQAVDRLGTITYRRDQPSPERILSQETTETMRALCHQVVVHGTGKRASIDEYRVGGKTGTAQMQKLDGRGYDSNRFTTVFAGFAPVNDPRVVSVIVIQEPKIKLRYGGYVCGPVFKEVVRETLIRMDVPNDPVDDKDVPLTRIASDVEGVSAPAADLEIAPQDFRQAKAVVDEKPEMAQQASDGLIPRVEIEELEATLASVREPLDGLELVGAGVDGIERSGDLPDLRGLSMREARERLGALGIPWDPRGSGWVVGQDPAPGTPLSQVSLCAVEFSTRRAESINETTGTS